MGLLLTEATAAGQVPNKSTSAVKFSRINEVIEKWAPDQHLYVKGELGISTPQLDGLEAWLDANARHWVIVLMQNASGESYAAADGNTYAGMDAVEHALGKDLNNRTNFGTLVHPQTGERDAAVFVLFLQERKFSYYASDAQDRRNLGDGNWIGQLDQPAIRAMRSGGRILDAVKDTVQSIDQQLARRIGAEAATAERAKLEAQRALESLKSSIAHTRTLLDDVKIASAEYRKNYNAATGTLALPPLQQWREEVASIEADPQPENVRALQQRLARTDDAILAHLNGYAAAQGLDAQLQTLNADLKALAQSPIAAPSVATARKAIADAERVVAAGDEGVPEILKKVDAAIADGRKLIAIEQARIEREQLVRAWVRWTIVVMLALFLLAIATLLWVMNRRRRGIMRKALATLEERESQVTKETEGIDRLFTRNDELLGSKDKIIERGYVGATREASERAINYVDDLFIMSKEVRRVVKEAKELVDPLSPFAKVMNLFSGSNYQQAVNLVTGKPLKFSRLNGLPWVLRERLAAEGKSPSTPDEITMTFEDVFQAFKQRGVDAQTMLDTVENCLTSIHETLSSAQDDLQKCVAQDKQLESESGSDNYFNLPDYLDSLIPSVASDLAEADKISAFDAVGAMRNFLPPARRKMTEAMQLGDVLIAARQKLFPELHQAADKLRELRFASNWIDAELRGMTERANALMKAAVERSIAEDTAAISAELTALVAKAVDAVQLAERIRHELHPEGEALKSRIAAARKDLAKQLSLAETAVLCEPDQTPDEHWSTAGKSLEAAGVSISIGQNTAARAAIDAMLAEVAQADLIIKASLEAVEMFEQQKRQTIAELKRLTTRLPQVQTKVDSLRQHYVRSALQTQAQGASGKQTAAAETVDLLLQAAAGPLDRVEDLLRLAEDEHRQGRVLHGAGVMRDASSQVALSHDQLDRIEAHLAAIESRSRENKDELTKVASRLRSLAANHSDPLVTQETLIAIQGASRDAEDLDRRLAASTAAPNPFEIGSSLQTLQQNIVALEARCLSDRQANAEAARAVAGARRQLQIAQQLVRQSQTDGIPDSQQTKAANDRIAVLSSALTTVEKDLRQSHGNWKAVDNDASRLQADLSAATDTLSGQLKSASQALDVFQQASQAVFQAEQWSGGFGIRAVGSPGVHELERARASLQQGNYSQVLEIARMASAAALAAIQQAEREVQRRQLEAEREAEAARRRREAELRRNTPSFGPIIIPGGGSRSSSSGGGLFGGGGSFGGGSSFGGGGSSGSSGGGSGSGFSRSGW